MQGPRVKRERRGRGFQYRLSDHRFFVVTPMNGIHGIPGVRFLNNIIAFHNRFFAVLTRETPGLVHLAYI